MPFELGGDESLGEGALRAAAEEVRDARLALRARDRSVDEAAHEARKRIKRARALLRLARGLIPGKLRRFQNACLRDAAGRLSATRDRRVIERTAQLLTAESGLEDGYLRMVADTLGANRPTPASERRAFRPAARLLGQTRLALIRCKKGQDGFPARGLIRAYSDGRSEMRAAARGGGSPHFHAWRRRAKDMRYQLEFLSPLWPGVMTALTQELHHLTDLLGRANDLEMLASELHAQALAAQEELFGELSAQKVGKMQCELWQEALSVGARLYADKPDVFVARMQACWEATRGK
jgi:CHAD domain-containing protein